jgi:hypothetical protein
MHRSLLWFALLAAILSVGYAWQVKSGFLGFAAYVSAGGGTSAHNAILSCREYYNSRPDTPFEIKLNCVSNAVGFMFRGVAAFVAGGFAEEAVREGFLMAIANGAPAPAGRAVVDLTALNDEINSHPAFIDSEHPVTVESVFTSDVGIDNAVAYGVSMGNYTDVIEYHTNGTHSMSLLANTEPGHAKRAYLDTGSVFFNFGNTIQGLKLTTYIGNRDSRLADYKNNLYNIGSKFVSSGTYQTSDSWTWAVCEGNTGFAYGRFITEYSGFGDNYEDVSPAPGCP